MKWISVKDRLPEQQQYCWIYGKIYDDNSEPFVFDGFFDQKSHDYRGRKLSLGPGWEYDRDRSNYVMLDQVTHWMPYYPPEPPKEGE